MNQYDPVTESEKIGDTFELNDAQKLVLMSNMMRAYRAGFTDCLKTTEIMWRVPVDEKE